MNTVLVTGASGFVGRAFYPLLLQKGYKVYGLFRKPPEGHIPYRFIPLFGDITKPNLGLEEVPKDIQAIYHLAGIHSLRMADKDGAIWETNVAGTRNVLDTMVKHNIRKLVFTSTAYSSGWEGVNPYARSKVQNEKDIANYADKYNLSTIILRPSVVMGTKEHPYPGHFMQFVSAVVKVHQRAELIRRKIEGTLRLPVIEPVFRIKGNAEGKLNLVTVDAVAEAMAAIDEEGTFWLTNPNPPTLGQLVEWVGEFIMVDIKIIPEFKPTPIEATFQKMASVFEPYLWGDNFPSNLKDCPPIDRSFIHETIQRSL